jgi:F0F1-type ATP synthase assembly protein I
MNREKRELFKSIGLVSSAGISVVLAIAIGVFTGRWLDSVFGTTPWFFFIFMFIGIAAGFRNIQVLACREIKKNDADKDQRS